MKIHNIGRGTCHFWNPNTGERLEIMVGINEVSEEKYKKFKDKINANLSLKVMKEEPPKASVPAPAPVVVEQAPAPEPQVAEVPAEVPADSAPEAEPTPVVEEAPATPEAGIVVNPNSKPKKANKAAAKADAEVQS